jgi:hypothetical protein
MLASVIAALAAALTLASCGRSAVALSNGRPRELRSSIGHVPLPAGAVLDPTLGGSGTEGYRLPPTAPFGAVDSFFSRRMPNGRSFDGLEWCDSASTPSISSRTWHEPGTDRFLVVQVLDGGKRGPAVVVHDEHGDGPCRPSP